VPGISYSGGRHATPIEALTDAVELPFPAPATCYSRHKLQAPKGICSTAHRRGQDPSSPRTVAKIAGEDA